MNSAATSRCIADAPGPGFVGLYSNRFAVAGIIVEIRGETPQSVDLGPQLLPSATDGGTHDVEVQVEWNSTIEPGRGQELFHSGCLWSVHKIGSGFLFDFTTKRLGGRPYKRLLVDEDFRQARVIR